MKNETEKPQEIEAPATKEPAIVTMEWVPPDWEREKKDPKSD